MDFGQPSSAGGDAGPPVTPPLNGGNGSAARNRNSDFASLMPQVAQLLLGEPNTALSTRGEWRYGTHGSLAVRPRKGDWFSHEEKRGGGVLDLIARQTGREGLADCRAWLRENGLEPSPQQTIKQQVRRGRVVERYDYRDQHGELRYQVERLEPKSFRQRRPGPQANAGWVYNLDGVEPLPYRLPEIIEAISLGRPIPVVEGEKDADALARLGITATCNSGGAGRWTDALTRHFAGASVVIIGDNDEAGCKHARIVAEKLLPVAASVRILNLIDHWSECPLKGDISDWLAGGGTREQLDEMLALAKLWKPAATEEKSENAPALEIGGKRTQAAMLLELLERDSAELYHAPDGTAYADVIVDGHRETHSLRGASFRKWWRHRFYAETEGAPNSEALSAAMGVAEAKAQFAGEERDVCLRVAYKGERIYIDLCDSRWRAIEVDAHGWRIVDAPPVRFRRKRGMLPLPEPKAGGSIASLLSLLPVSGDAYYLIVGFMLAALRGLKPFPALLLAGEQGTGKSCGPTSRPRRQASSARYST